MTYNAADSLETNTATADIKGGTVTRGNYIVTAQGIGLVVGIDYADQYGNVFQKPINAVVRGKSMLFGLQEVRRAKFTNFLAGKHGFGRMSWPEFIAIQTICLALVGTGIATWADRGWVAVAFVAALEGAILFGAWRNFTTGPS